MDPKKVANNILELLIDPTKIPVERRLYFRPEEILRNQIYEAAKADAQKAYGDQRHNSDFYPQRNRSLKREATDVMDRKTLVASLDVLSQNFAEDDPIAKDLRTMAYATAKMSDEELDARTVEAKKKVQMVKCPVCKKDVMKQTGYCLHCKDKIENLEGKKEEKPEDKPKSKKKAEDWTKEASDLVKRTLLSDVLGMDQNQRAMQNWPAGGGMEAPVSEEPAAPVLNPPIGEAAPEKEEAVTPKKEETTPPTSKKEETAPAPEKEEAPEEEEKEEKEATGPECAAPALPAVSKKEEEETTTATVDTDILKAATTEIIEGIEMETGIIEAGDLSAEDKAKLDLLFK